MSSSGDGIEGLSALRAGFFWPLPCSVLRGPLPGDKTMNRRFLKVLLVCGLLFLLSGCSATARGFVAGAAVAAALTYDWWSHCHSYDDCCHCH